MMNVHLPFQLSDNSSLIANKCIFDGCLEYAIQMDTDKEISDEARHVYCNELPNDMDEIKLNECQCVHSDSKDIVLKPKDITAMAEWLDVNQKL